MLMDIKNFQIQHGRRTGYLNTLIDYSLFPFSYPLFKINIDLHDLGLSADPYWWAPALSTAGDKNMGVSELPVPIT